MGSLVLCKIAAPGKPFLTNRTLIWLFSCVGSHVFCKITAVGKSCLTNRTLKWLFSCVGSHVSCKRTVSSKPFLTNITLIWLFSSVCSHMFCKRTIFKKSFFTKRTVIHNVRLVHFHMVDVGLCGTQWRLSNIFHFPWYMHHSILVMRTWTIHCIPIWYALFLILNLVQYATLSSSWNWLGCCWVSCRRNSRNLFLQHLTIYLRLNLTSLITLWCSTFRNLLGWGSTLISCLQDGISIWKFELRKKRLWRTFYCK